MTLFKFQILEKNNLHYNDTLIYFIYETGNCFVCKEIIENSRCH